VIDGHKETLDGGSESARRIFAAGGRIGLGGDYGFGWNPHGQYARELTFFVKHVGFSPLDTITCATKTGAEILGREREIGTLEKGKLGDILVVDGDIIADISILEDRQRFIAVMQGGIVKAGPIDSAHDRVRSLELDPQTVRQREPLRSSGSSESGGRPDADAGYFPRLPVAGSLHLLRRIRGQG